MGSGIYIHVPFCVSKCSYCDFYSITGSVQQRNRFIQSLLREIDLKTKDIWLQHTFDTIYFGGGTPSILKPEQINHIVQHLKNNYRIQPDCEITVEANPETVNIEYFEKLADGSVNRISLGIQSFEDSELKTLGRAHTVQTGLEAVKAMRESGYDNFNIDLIFGIPGQSIDSWCRTLNMAIKQNPAHISAYGLTVEKGTPLEKLIQSGKLKIIEEQIQLDMYKILIKELTQNGYGRYEISNFAKPAKESRHNLKYWRNDAYIGFGPSAHSYNGQNRWANVYDLELYCDMLERGQIPTGYEEQLSDAQKAMERLMMGIRLADGVSLSEVISTIDESSLVHMADNGFVEISAGKLIITEKGLPLSDKIIAQLIKL
ncbi:MAG: radical SAM family heme chaperone HemW [candidate division Zixibacteria bacterium]|nr:radical SAM family heme chaperone HemW [candidate division Zixibacteria bacterium]